MSKASDLNQTRELIEELKSLAGIKGLILMSGGMDSTILAAVMQKIGCDLTSVSFDYGQKNREELNRAKRISDEFGIDNVNIDLTIFKELAGGVSANINKDIQVPNIKEVLGDPQPVTYVPNRNMILLSLTAAVAESRGINTILVGLQEHDQYSYFDTTMEFVTRVNKVLELNRKNPVSVKAPLVRLSKSRELLLMEYLGIPYEILKETITCYDWNQDGACAVCPSCAERLKAFSNIGMKDPSAYRVNIG